MAKNDVSIVVTLRDQASKEFSRIGATAEGMKQKIAGLRGELAGIAAGAGIAGLGMYMAKTAIEWGKAVDDVADITGAAGEEASKLLVIGKSVGVSIEQSAGIFAKFGKAVSNAKDDMITANAKGAESNDMFSRLGMTLDDLQDQNLYSVFQKVVAVMRDMEDGADKDRVAMEMFGRSGWELHDMLNLTQAQMDKTVKKAQDMGLIMSSDTAQAAEKLDRQINALTGTANKLAIGIGTELIPVLQEKANWLQGLVDEYSKLDAEQRKFIAEVAVMAAELGAALVVIRTATTALELMGIAAAGAAGPYAALAVAIGLAAKALYDYNTQAVSQIDSVEYDERTGEVRYIKKAAAGMGDLKALEGQKSPAELAKLRGDEARAKITLRAPAAYGGGGGAKSEYDRLAQEIERLQEKINDMIADLSGKIVDETGTTLQANLAKVAAEVDKFQFDINAAAEKGIDVSEAQGKLDSYAGVMRDKYLKTWRESWQALKDDSASVNAQLLDDKNAEADADLQITKTRLDKEREDKLKAVQVDKDDAVARLAVEKWYSDQVALAERKAAQTRRENAMAAYRDQIEHNNLLAELNGSTQLEIDELNRGTLDKYIAYCKEQLATAKLTSDERLRIEQGLADAQRQIWEMNGRDLKTGWDEGIRQFKAETIDYGLRAAASIDDAWNTIDSSVQEHIENIFSLSEDLGEGIKGIISDIGKAITKLFADMVYQKFVLKPLHDWFGSILDGFSSGGGDGSSSSGVYGASESLNRQAMAAAGLPTFAAGGVADGWSIVGEEGPELVNFSNPGRVYTAQDSKKMLASGGGGLLQMSFNIGNSRMTRRLEGEVSELVKKIVYEESR